MANELELSRNTEAERNKSLALRRLTARKKLESAGNGNGNSNSNSKGCSVQNQDKTAALETKQHYFDDLKGCVEKVVIPPIRKSTVIRITKVCDLILPGLAAN